MINLTKVYFGKESSSDALRYGRGQVSSSQRKPVVVWTMTRTCNLSCLHCYTGSESRAYPNELSTAEGKAMLKDLAEFGVPAVLFSGGEPLTRPDFDSLALYAKDLGLRVTLSTNGMLLTPQKAQVLKEIGVRYVGISLDGRPEVHDHFRQKAGAYEAALQGIRNCRAAGLPVGLRLTLTKSTASELDWLFGVVDKEGIERVCFYHLVYSGRGRRLMEQELSPLETRKTLEDILKHTAERVGNEKKLEVLTVDQAADGPFLLLKLSRERPEGLERARELLRANGGGAAGSGVGIANIDPVGGVHPDQFWQANLGNIREKKFSEIWAGPGAPPLLAQLRDRLPLLKGRCGSCAYKPECGGSFRARALAAYNDPWAEDPACYLDASEIAAAAEETV